MKKFSAVLLVLALVGGALFASFTGSATVEFGVNLDEKAYGFTNSTALAAEISILERLVDKAGEGDIYAEINAKLSVDLDWAKGHGLTDDLALTAKITSAKIIGDKWYVGILGAMGAPNYASSAVDVDSDGDTYLDLAFEGPSEGVEVGFAGYTFGLSMPYDVNNWGAETYGFFVSAETPEYEFADGLTGQFGAAGLFSGAGSVSANGGAASLKVGYAKDDLDVSLASDLQFVKVGSADLVFDAEVAVAAVYDFLSVDVYYGTKEFPAQEDDELEVPIFPYGGVKNVLSVQLGAEIEGFDITVAGKDLVNSQDLSASVGYTIDAFSVEVRGGYNVKGKKWTAGAGVEYKHDMFTASLDADLNGTDEVKGLELGATIKSTTLVDGATLSLGYANANILADKKGAITASAKIAF